MRELDEFVHEVEPPKTRREAASRRAMIRRCRENGERRKLMRQEHRPPSAEPSLPKFKCLEDD